MCISYSFSSNPSFFKQQASKLVKGNSFSHKYANLQLGWDSLVHFVESNSGAGCIFDNLSEKKPDLAAVASGDVFALQQLACILLLSYLSTWQEVFADKIASLNQEDQAAFVNLLKEVCEIDLCPSEEQNVAVRSSSEHLPPELNPFVSEVAALGPQIVMQNLQEEIVRLERCTQEQEALLREKDSKVLELSKQIRAFQSVADQKPLEDAALQRRIEEQASMISSLEEEVTALKRQNCLIPDLKRQLKAAQEQTHQLTHQISHIGSDMSSNTALKTEIDSLRQQNASHASELAQKNAECEALAERIQGMHQEQQKLTLATSELQKLNKSLNERIAQLQVNSPSELSSAATSPTATTNSLFTDHEIDRLQRENAQLQAKVSLLQNSGQDSDLQTISESLNALLQEKDAEIQTLKAKFASLKESVKREQRLMMSAWYDLGVSGQKKALFPNVALTPTSAAPESPSTPGGGWLQLQRNKVDSLLLNSKFTATER